MLAPTFAIALSLAVAPAADLSESLPRTTGAARVASLDRPVSVTRDALGIPVIEGSSIEDVYRAQGFVHAQDRFFQMDLARRLAAGRLAEVVGRAVVDLDREHRRYRFQLVADEVVARSPAPIRRALEAYAEGVNAGLADLQAPPPLYGMLGRRPVDWRPADTVLINLTMFLALNHNARLERPLGVVRELLPPELVEFLTPETSRFAAPLLPEAPWTGLPIPGPEVVDLRRVDAGERAPDHMVNPSPIAVGSNNWAVAGSRSTHGGAMVANDPHLRLTVPGIWYRAELRWKGGSALGLSLPGSPGIVIGSNGHVAWGFTNSMVDTQDLVLVEIDADDPDRYRVPGGWERFERLVETIRVAGEEDRVLVLRRTRWGIVTDVDAFGRPLVLKWTALDPSMINLNVLNLPDARTVDEAVEIARGWNGPSQNALFADRDGRIGWIVTGYLPQRRGMDGTVPVAWHRAGTGWTGPRDEADRPMLVDPPNGVLFTANNRTVDRAWARTLGNRWALGARASRIADLLAAAPKFDESDLFRIQLDTRLEVFDFYAECVREATQAARRGTPAAEAREIVAAWNGHADSDQPAVPILDAYRKHLHDTLLAPLLAPLLRPCRQHDETFRFTWRRGEETVRRLLEERPAHLLPPGMDDWTDVLRAALDGAIEELLQQAPLEGLRRPWGLANEARVQHPVTRAAPMFGPMLDMPRAPLSGHRLAIRVATPSYGASTRMVVSPGREQHGILHIPAGQSGHPRSPHYRDSHPAWIEGRATPFLAGEGQAVLELRKK